MNFSTLKELISKIRDNQANYQKVLICNLAQAQNHTLTRDQAAKVLKANNPRLSHDETYYKSLSCPVYKILGQKGRDGL